MSVFMSPPIISMLKATNNYSIVNWQSFLKLPNNQIRLLYFYFCLNVKVSKYFTEFGIKSLVYELYSTSGSVFNATILSQEVRKILQHINDHQEDLINFDFQLMYVI
uniref:Uncharacterized protein n=1 Tax=Gracilaria hainanensis TaxID=2871843 RepID=A0AAU7YQZ8_9FLOR